MIRHDRTRLQLDPPLQDKIANNLEETRNVIFGAGFGGITDSEVGPDGYLMTDYHYIKGAMTVIPQNIGRHHAFRIQLVRKEQYSREIVPKFEQAYLRLVIFNKRVN